MESIVSVLDEAVRSHPDTWWWVKADGTDLVSGLGESVSGEWSGDIDLNDRTYMAYRKHLVALMVKKKIFNC